jgi:hypothetical protein
MFHKDDKTGGAVYEPGSQEQALGQFAGVGEFKNLNKKPGGNFKAADGANRSKTNESDEAVYVAEGQDGALADFAGSPTAAGKLSSEKESDFAGDVLSIGKGSDYGWNSDSPFYKG